MSAQLLKAFADKKVVIRNRTASGVMVQTAEGNIIVPAQITVDLTARRSLSSLKRSRNLKGLVSSRTLEVIS